MNHTSNVLHACDLMLPAEPVPHQITVKALQKLLGILREFHRIVFSKKAEDLEHWIEQASNWDTIPELKSFIDGLKHDISVVKNAIMFDYKNGLAEGSVTKIKLIKRIMYGRNSFTLLKAKVLMHELLYANSN